MKYLIAGLIIGGFLGQMFGYAVAGQHPRIVEVEVAGKLEESAPVQKMRGLMAAMPLAITVTETGAMPQEAHRGGGTVRESSDYPRMSFAATSPLQRDEIAQLIEWVR